MEENTIIYSVPICANCEFFDWREGKGDAGYCSKKRRVVDAKTKACLKFNYNPPECRAAAAFYQEKRRRRRQG